MKSSLMSRSGGWLISRVRAVLALGACAILLGGCPPPATYSITVTPPSSTTVAAGKVVLTLTPLFGTAAWTGTLNVSGAGGCGTLSATTATASATTPTPTVTFTAGSPTANCTETVTASIPGMVFGTNATGTATIVVMPAPALTSTVQGFPATATAPTVSVTPDVVVPVWTYVVDVKTNGGATDYLVEVFIDLDVACPLPTSSAGGTFTPATGPSAHWLVKYSGTSTTTDTIVFKCDAKAGGTAKFDIRPDSAQYSASLSVTGPQK